MKQLISESIKNLLQSIKKKGKGNGAMFPLAIMMLMMMLIFLILVYKRHVLEYNYSYINNSLTQAMNELINELTALGVTDISLSGTTMSPAGYGNAIYLVVTGHISVPGKTGLDGWRWIKRNEAVDFRINQKSIAKY